MLRRLPNLNFIGIAAKPMVRAFVEQVHVGCMDLEAQ
jgi:hypothetical protein